MSTETNAANVSMSLLTGGGIVAAVNEYQVAISLSIAFLGLIMGLFFHILAVRHRNKIAKRDHLEYKEKIRQEIEREMQENIK